MSGVRTICICTETEREHRPFYACPAHNAAKGRPATTPADVTREPTGGQGLWEAVTRILCDGGHCGTCKRRAAEVVALPELAAVIADADNWRRATTGDPTEPLPLAMQARELLVKNRELEATVARVRELAKRLYRDAWNIMADPATRERGAVADLLGIAIDGEPQP